jgi:putative YhdH/YhfP family quinone oxidoreductase
MSVDELVRNGVRPEDGEVLVTGATGGVGSVAVALLAKLGYNVVAATGKVERAADFLRGLGAASIISRAEATDTSRPMLRSRWAGVVDCVGGEMLETALASTKNNAVVAISGLVASPKLNTTVFPFILRGVRLVGIESAEFPHPKRAALWQKLATDWKLDNLSSLAREVTLETLNPEIDTILAGGQTGRVVVDLT